MSLLRTAVLSCLLLAGAGVSPAWAAGEEQQIRDKLIQVVPATKIVAVRPSAMPGLFEVELNNGVVYASPDGQFILQGDLIQIKGKQVVNLTEQVQAAKRVTLLKQVDRRDEIIFPAQGKARGVLTVFTDINCGYCRKFHQEVPALNQAGIEVRYLAYPRDMARTGPHGGTAAEMSAIWCSANREQLLTQAKQGQEIAAPRKDCKSPVAEQYALGQRLGVTGTPTVFNDKGEQLGGYLTAQQAIQRLGLR